MQAAVPVNEGRARVKVLIISQYFWPESFRINDIALGLKERGHDVTVLTGKPNYPGGDFFSGYGYFKRAREDYHGISVRRVPLCPRGRGGSLRLALNYLSFALLASVLGPWRCREGYDAILVYEPSPITVGLPAVVMKWLKGAPVLFWVQDLWPESISATGAVRSPLALGLVERLVCWIYRGCDRILVQSEAFVEPIERLGVERERIHYFPNSAEGIYQPLRLEESAPERARIPAGFRVVFAGNIGKAQDFETILGAVERLKTYQDIQWVILGDGRMLSWVAEQVGRRNLADTVHLLGRHPVESMPRYFALADVMLVTLRDEPIFALTIPAKVQSYLACARPVIAALRGEGARVIREAGAGLTPPPEDPDALAEAVLAMYSMPVAERRAMGARGREYFEAHFERNVLLQRLDDWMKELAQRASLCAS